MSAEARSQLYIASKIGYLDQSQLAELLRLAEEVGRILGGLRVSVNAKRDKKS